MPQNCTPQVIIAPTESETFPRYRAFVLFQASSVTLCWEARIILLNFKDRVTLGLTCSLQGLNRNAEEFLVRLIRPVLYVELPA
jgi:hypothetical protein